MKFSEPFVPVFIASAPSSFLFCMWNNRGECYLNLFPQLTVSVVCSPSHIFIELFLFMCILLTHITALHFLDIVEIVFCLNLRSFPIDFSGGENSA